MINVNQVKTNMPVVCSENGQFAVVDHMEGTETIKLNKDKQGKHHYIPMKWVTRVDDKVHVDRPGDQAMREWSESAPAQAATAKSL
jgi:hypothetical protein